VTLSGGRSQRRCRAGVRSDAVEQALRTTAARHSREDRLETGTAVGVPFNAVPFNAVPFNAVPFNAVPFNAVPFNAVPFNTVPASGTSEGLISGDAPLNDNERNRRIGPDRPRHR